MMDVLAFIVKAIIGAIIGFLIFRTYVVIENQWYAFKYKRREKKNASQKVAI